MEQTKLPLPNPGDWYDAEMAIAALGVSRATFYVMISDGRVVAYPIGTQRLYWKPAIDDLAIALTKTKPRPRG
jgi:hypothetical protein